MGVRVTHGIYRILSRIREIFNGCKGNKSRPQGRLANFSGDTAPELFFMLQ